MAEAGVRRQAEFYYQQLDALRSLRQQVRQNLLTESARHQAKRLKEKRERADYNKFYLRITDENFRSVSRKRG